MPGPFGNPLGKAGAPGALGSVPVGGVAKRALGSASGLALGGRPLGVTKVAVAQNYLNFYAPVVDQVTGDAGSVTSTSISLGTSNAAWIKGSSPPATSWFAEITLATGWIVNGQFIGIGDQNFWNGTPSYNSTTGNHVNWYVGNNFSYGNPSSITFNGSNYLTAPNYLDTLGLVYNALNNKMRIYLNGIEIFTATMAAGGTYYPVAGYWTAGAGATFRSTPSSYQTNYTLP